MPAAAIRKWKTRGRVYPVDAMRGPGRNAQVPLYDLEDLRPHAEQYHQAKARRAEKEHG